MLLNIHFHQAYHYFIPSMITLFLPLYTKYAHSLLPFFTSVQLLPRPRVSRIFAVDSDIVISLLGAHCLHQKDRTLLGSSEAEKIMVIWDIITNKTFYFFDIFWWAILQYIYFLAHWVSNTQRRQSMIYWAMCI